MEIEAQIKQLETEQDYEKLVTLFSAVTLALKNKLDAIKVTKGKITEIIRDMDNYVEKEFKPC